jgi:colanic acid/amylovoran biosynthesis glycosyltransferase
MNNELPHDSARKNILIYRSILLSYSETFIPSQAEKFQLFTPYYIGFMRVNGVKLPDERTLPISSSRPVVKLRLWAALFGQMDPWFENAARQIHPKLVHAHFEGDGIRALPLAQSLNVPLVVTCHGYDVTVERRDWGDLPVMGKYYEGRRKKLFKTASLFFGVSRFICDQMLKNGYPPEKVRLHYIGVDTERFRPDPKFPKQPKILFVGRLVDKKGCSDLLRAMKKVNVQHPEVQLDICGDGPLKKELEEFAEEAKLNVRFCGVQPPEVIQELLKASLMLCSPSARSPDGNSEGLGIVNLEAQAVGIPVVGTAHGGIPEAVDHGVTGLLSAERDPNALAENILTLLSDTTLRTKMGLAARERMVRLFDLSQQSAILEKTYMEML